MHASQANRAIIAARITTKPARRRPVRGGQALGYAGRKSHATRLTSTQRNSVGRVSEWNRSPYAPKGGWR